MTTPVKSAIPDTGDLDEGWGWVDYGNCLVARIRPFTVDAVINKQGRETSVSDIPSRQRRLFREVWCEREGWYLDVYDGNVDVWHGKECKGNIGPEGAELCIYTDLPEAVRNLVADVHQEGGAR